MKVGCPALQGGKFIPSRYAYPGVRGGENTSLPVSWSMEPTETRSFVLSIIDRHPMARSWVHWILLDIPVTCHALPEGASGNRSRLPEGSVELHNSYGEPGYGGPMPPRGSGPHDYVIALHALNVPSLSLSEKSSYPELQTALKGKVLVSAEVIGVFEQ
ncbi:MAG: YbhB/YbcL family Raf kinase inhibitor-like protein [Bacteroidota bacterium]